MFPMMKGDDEPSQKRDVGKPGVSSGSEDLERVDESERSQREGWTMEKEKVDNGEIKEL